MHAHVLPNWTVHWSERQLAESGGVGGGGTSQGHEQVMMRLADGAVTRTASGVFGGKTTTRFASPLARKCLRWTNVRWNRPSLVVSVSISGAAVLVWGGQNLHGRKAVSASD